jgi:chromosomal replication initiation ATPase DnaA
MNDFDALALDESNAPAVLAARAVAEDRKPPFAPLVIVGPRGSGIGELFDSLVADLGSRRSDDRVERFEADGLANRQREAMLSGRSEALRSELAGAGLVIMEGLESLPRHPECQGLLADLLDARRAAGRETVVGSTLDPSAIEGLDPRVLRRLQQGKLTGFAMPGESARFELLAARQNGRAPGLSEDALRALAAAKLPSLRDYTGALARLLAFQEASPVPLSPEDALLLVGVPNRLASPAAEPPHPPADLPPGSAPGSDEFSAFLSDVTGELTGRLDDWRRRVSHAIEHWGAQGLRTHALESLLEEEALGDPDASLRAYEAAAEAILGLAREAAELAPDLAGAEVFRDPTQISAARVLVEEARSAAPLSAPLPQYRWEEFAEGPALRLTVRAGRDVIREPGSRYSPLVVTGGTGTGKSHFLHGIGNALIARGLGQVVCLAGPALAAEIRSLPDAGAAVEWRKRYAWAGAFLLDDLHLLAGELRAQQELAALMAELQEGRRQLVFASLRPLEQLPDFDPRLMALLQNGLTVELPPPDREVRLAVIRRLLAGDPAAEDAALVDYLASRPADSVRAVQGLVQRVVGAAAAQQTEPSPQLAREVLEFGGVVTRRGRIPGTGRTSGGIPVPGIGLLKSGEKTVQRWPRPAERLIEELR